MITNAWRRQVERWEAGPLGGPALVPYLCPASYWTIGYGATTGLDGKPVTKDHPPITPAIAEQLLARDLDRAEAALDRMVFVPLSQGERDALVDFIYNLGPGRFRSSTLLKKVLARRVDEAVTEFHKWVHGGGRRLNGLVIRRAAEASRYLQ